MRHNFPVRQWEKWWLKEKTGLKSGPGCATNLIFSWHRIPEPFPPLPSVSAGSELLGFSFPGSVLLQGGGFGFGPGLQCNAIIRGCCIFWAGTLSNLHFSCCHVLHSSLALGKQYHNTRQDEAGKLLPQASPSICLLLILGYAFSWSALEP